MKNYLYDFVIAIIVNKEKNILKFFNEIVLFCQNKKFLIVFLFDKSSDPSTFNYFKLIEKNNLNLRVLYDPKVKNLADAYYKANLFASKINAKWTLSMIAGYRHSPRDLRKFIKKFDGNNICIWGFRTKLTSKAPLIRKFISLLGHFSSKIILNIPIPDLTSGFYAIRSHILHKKLKEINFFLSKSHFIETELKFIFRRYSYSLVNISYKTYNKTLSFSAIFDSIKCLVILFMIRLKKNMIY
jgi:hypothetical protein